MSEWWDNQIRRANLLAEQTNGSAELLTFYAHLLRAQRDIYLFLRTRQNWLPSGDLQGDLPVLIEPWSEFLKVVQSRGPALLAAKAGDLLTVSGTAIEEILLDHWRKPSAIDFFPKAYLQPYARWLAETGTPPISREHEQNERHCPFCGGNPQVSFLQNKETTAESGNRDLICATCLSSWSFRRVVCANCGEERPEQLAYFQSPEFDHVRIEACDSCKHYLKGVDLTRLGLAAPLVDEIAAAPLDLWAKDHGYTKIELNLVGI
ncbi:MAG TPA: formate dehydrogenase accessory protein FdhE [Pyrinomonadaceae bacterium]|nr:formate dehydrogenase accessory protein FdhE [Pyrinomonadaceae bacterium]